MLVSRFFRSKNRAGLILLNNNNYSYTKKNYFSTKETIENQSNNLVREKLDDDCDPWDSLLSIKGKPAPNLSLSHRTSLSSLHFVFLEGPCCTLKKKLINRLDAMGYATKSYPFIDLCLSNPHFPPSGKIMSLKWNGLLFKGLEDAVNEHHKDPTKFKNNICFVHRSFLSPYIYFSPSLGVRHEGWGLMMESRMHLNTTIVLCDALDYAVNLQLHRRYELASDDEKALRDNLQEMDETFRNKIKKRYLDLEKENGIFDFTLNNSNPKQSILPLLNVLGISFSEGMNEFWSQKPNNLQSNFEQKNRYTPFYSSFEKKK